MVKLERGVLTVVVSRATQLLNANGATCANQDEQAIFLQPYRLVPE